MRVILVTAAIATAFGCAPTLAGRLATSGGEPVGGAEARVNISSLDKAASVPSMTLSVDGAGAFSTSEELPDGDYLVEALVPGYKIESKRVHVGDAQDEGLELTLSPLEAIPARATSANLDAPEGRGAGGASLTPPTF